MYMANVKILRLVPNATYIPLTRVGGFALGDAKVPTANGFASQWNIGLSFQTPVHPVLNPEHHKFSNIMIPYKIQVLAFIYFVIFVPIYPSFLNLQNLL